MRKRKTREERRREGLCTMERITGAFFLLLLLMMLAVMLSTSAKSSEYEITEEQGHDDGRLPGDDIPAMERCYLTEDEVEAAENEMIEATLLSKGKKLEHVTVTAYCICEQCCGKTMDHPAYGITASGLRATPGVSVAVDTTVIPMGADVLVDFGDGDIQYYRADDTGSAVRGNHIDLCMESHEAARAFGIRRATVWAIE